MLKRLLLLTIFTFLFSQAEITNIQASQRTDGSQIVDITYDLLEDDLFQVFTVIVEVSIDGGNNFSLLNNITGEFGDGITPGFSKNIIWNVGEQLPNSFFDNLVINIKAESTIINSELPFEFVDVPAGEYPDNCGMGYPDNIDYDYRIMEHYVTNAQYAEFLIMLLENGEISGGMPVYGNYEGDAYTEEGTYLYHEWITEESVINDDGYSEPYECGISWNGTTYIVREGEGDLPVHCVSWVGAKVFANHYGLRFPLIKEYQKAEMLHLIDSYPHRQCYGSPYNFEHTGELSQIDDNGVAAYHIIDNYGCEIWDGRNFDEGACWISFRLVTTY